MSEMCLELGPDKTFNKTEKKKKETILFPSHLRALQIGGNVNKELRNFFLNRLQ